jgi:Arc/MetJ-type ribon-helix-helix transcriptional regulator
MGLNTRSRPGSRMLSEFIGVDHCEAGSIDIPLPRRHTQDMTIDVAKDVEEFLQEQVRSGACANPSDLVNDVLRSVRDQQSRPFETTPEIEAWLLEAADKPVSPLTKADFDAIRKRVRARTSSSAS